MAYTKVSKPTVSNYTNLNAVGKQQYDESSITYDSSTVFYDGVNTLAYTLVAKPSGGKTIRAGMISGLLMPLTYSKEYDVGSPYTKIPKPI